MFKVCIFNNQNATFGVSLQISCGFQDVLQSLAFAGGMGGRGGGRLPLFMPQGSFIESNPEIQSMSCRSWKITTLLLGMLLAAIGVDMPQGAAGARPFAPSHDKGRFHDSTIVFE